jgi:hypothetical protein
MENLRGCCTMLVALHPPHTMQRVRICYEERVDQLVERWGAENLQPSKVLRDLRVTYLNREELGPGQQLILKRPGTNVWIEGTVKDVEMVSGKVKRFLVQYPTPPAGWCPPLPSGGGATGGGEATNLGGDDNDSTDVASEAVVVWETLRKDSGQAGGGSDKGGTGRSGVGGSGGAGGGGGGGGGSASSEVTLYKLLYQAPAQKISQDGADDGGLSDHLLCDFLETVAVERGDCFEGHAADGGLFLPCASAACGVGGAASGSMGGEPGELDDFQEEALRALGALLATFLVRKLVHVRLDADRASLFRNSFSSFLFDYLCQGDLTPVLSSAPAACAALSDFNPTLSAQYAAWLSTSNEDDLKCVAVSWIDLPDSFLDRLKNGQTESAKGEKRSGADGTGDAGGGAGAEAGSEGADEMTLTFENREHILLASCRHILLDSRRRGLVLVRDGFTAFKDYSSAFSASLALLSGNDLKALLCGECSAATAPDVLRQLVRSKRDADGVDVPWSETAMLQWEELRRAVGAMTSSQLEAFLQFTTSSRVLPQTTCITVHQSETSKYPTASTCSCELFIPTGPSVTGEGSEPLKSLLHAAIEHAQSMGFLME